MALGVGRCSAKKGHLLQSSGQKDSAKDCQPPHVQKTDQLWPRSCFPSQMFSFVEPLALQAWVWPTNSNDFNLLSAANHRLFSVKQLQIVKTGNHCTFGGKGSSYLLAPNNSFLRMVRARKNSPPKNVKVRPLN